MKNQDMTFIEFIMTLFIVYTLLNYAIQYDPCHISYTDDTCIPICHFSIYNLFKICPRYFYLE